MTARTARELVDELIQAWALAVETGNDELAGQAAHLAWQLVEVER